MIADSTCLSDSRAISGSVQGTMPNITVFPGKIAPTSVKHNDLVPVHHMSPVVTSNFKKEQRRIVDAFLAIPVLCETVENQKQLPGDLNHPYLRWK